jgi:membrane-associated protease RseP (regulator of RpoE activity)
LASPLPPLPGDFVPREDPWRAPDPLRAFIGPPLPRRTPWQRWGRNLVLFLTTAVSIFLAGRTFWSPRGGSELAFALLAILGSHEMGHYLACRYYRVDATLPFFIPALWLPLGGLLGWVPVPFMGTFGAVIRIRDRFPHRRALFDIGIAGPLAGFAVCLPVLALGLFQAHAVPDTADATGLTLGEPLLFHLAQNLFLRPLPPGTTLSLGPLGMAAWFGLLVTALNLIPVGQLDGGHVVYALLPRRARLVSRMGWWICIGLVAVSPSWLVWAILLRFLGQAHPPTSRDEAPVGRGRVVVGLLGLLVFALCLTPDPFPGVWKEFGDLPAALMDVLRSLVRR